MALLAGARQCRSQNHCDGMRKRDVWPAEADPQLGVDKLRRPPLRFVGTPVVAWFRLPAAAGKAPPPRPGQRQRLVVVVDGVSTKPPSHIDTRCGDPFAAILAAKWNPVDQISGVLDLTHSDVVPVLVSLHEPVQVPERSPGQRGEGKQREVPLLGIPDPTRRATK